MNNDHHLTADTLCRLLRYEEDTGHLFWRERNAAEFSDGYHRSDVRCAMWNARYSGKAALNQPHVYGYRNGAILNKKHYAHRVIWAMKTGTWPVAEIDHIDLDRSNNRWANLRAATRAENARNQRLRVTNKSGFKGVSWSKEMNKWHSTIWLECSQISLGFFSEKSDAAAAYVNASHKYHGNFARAN